MRGLPAGKQRIDGAEVQTRAEHERRGQPRPVLECPRPLDGDGKAFVKPARHVLPTGGAGDENVRNLVAKDVLEGVVRVVRRAGREEHDEPLFTDGKAGHEGRDAAGEIAVSVGEHHPHRRAGVLQTGQANDG